MADWDKIVVLHFHAPKRLDRHVSSIKSAARVLLGEWPLADGASYRRAIITCAAALNGKISERAAQASFVAAAMEAAIPYEILDSFETEIGMICKALLSEADPAHIQ